MTCDGSVVSPGTLVSSTNTTDRNDITEILSKVALNTINLQSQIQNSFFLKLYCHTVFNNISDCGSQFYRCLNLEYPEKNKRPAPTSLSHKVLSSMPCNENELNVNLSDDGYW